MNNKIKNIIVTSVFVAFVAFFAVLCTVTHFNPKDYSTVEKRPLAQFPTDVTWADILDNKDKVDPETGKVEKSPISQIGFESCRYYLLLYGSIAALMIFSKSQKKGERLPL